jgi:hypothetical protein
MVMPQSRSLAPIAEVERKIHLIRGKKIMLDSDLARLYGVPVYRINEAVKRNRDRFPEEFAFQLNKEEFTNLRSQFAISSWGGRRYLPWAFTEHGVVMLSSILRSKRAIQMNIAVVRAFVALREMIAGHKELADRIEKLERNQGDHASILSMLVEEIETMKALPEPPKRKIGF